MTNARPLTDAEIAELRRIATPRIVKAFADLADAEDALAEAERYASTRRATHKSSAPSATTERIAKAN